MYLYFYSSFKCSHLQFALQREPECEYVEFADSCYNIYQIWYFFEYNIITTPTKEKTYDMTSRYNKNDVETKLHFESDEQNGLRVNYTENTRRWLNVG